MKFLRSFHVISFTFLLLNIAILNSCKNPAEDVSIQVNTNIFKSPTILQFKNANPKGSTPSNMSLSFTGTGANFVRTITGGTNFNVSNGFINIVLDRNANPSPTNPIKVTATVTSPGFAPSYLELTFTDPEAKQFHTIEMLQYARPAEGTAAVVKTNALNGGQTAAPITVATTPNATQPQSSTIAIPSNTGFKDAAGNTISGNQIETRIIYSAINSQGNMLSNFGMTPITNGVNANGQPITSPIKAMPIAYASINMYAGTSEIKTFTNPITLDMELPDGGTNPNTGQAFKVGDQIDVWSVNETSGLWKEEGKGSVVLNTNNKLVVRKQITHLTGYGLVFPTETKTLNLTINRNLGLDDEYFNIIYSGGTRTVFFKTGETSKSVSITFETSKLPPAPVTVMPVNTSAYTFESLMMTTIFMSPGTTPLNKTMNFTRRDAVKANLSLSIKCNDKNLLAAANMGLKFVDLNTGEESIVIVENGKASGYVQNGHKYRVFAEFDGVSYSTTFTVNSGTAIIDAVDNLTAFVTSNLYGLSEDSFRVIATITKKCN